MNSPDPSELKSQMEKTVAMMEHDRKVERERQRDYRDDMLPQPNRRQRRAAAADARRRSWK